MIRRIALLCACATLAASGVATAAPSAGSTNLPPVDYAFIGSTYLATDTKWTPASSARRTPPTPR